MSKTYAQVQKQIESLQREADQLRKKEVDDVIARIKEAIDVYGLTAADLGLSGGGRRAAVGKPKAAAKPRRGRTGRAVKFRDDKGNTWGGRGPHPHWLRDALAAGRQLSDFAV